MDDATVSPSDTQSQDERPANGGGETPSGEASPEDRLSQEMRFDRILNAVVIALLLAVVGVGAWFGFTIYQVRWQERMSTPSGRAIAELEDQIRANPNDVVLRVRLGEAYATAGMYDEALDSFEQGLKLDPEHSGAFLDIGLVLLAQGEYADAETAFQKVLEVTEGMDYEELSQRREKAYFYLGQLATEDGRYEDAIGYLKAALRVRRDASDTYLELARAYHGLGEVDAAIENLRIAVTFDPNYGEARFLLGKIYLEDEQEAYAAVEFRKAADLAPESDAPVEALASLGDAEDRLENAKRALEDGDRTGALDQVTVAVAIDPNLIEGLLMRGTLLEADSERLEEALSTFERVLEFEPENEDAKQGVERVNALIGVAAETPAQ